MTTIHAHGPMATPTTFPARKADVPNPISIVGRISSRTTGTAQAHESILEKICLQRLDVDPEVLSYQVQPLSLTIRSRGKVFTATPDVEVITRTGREVLEIKPSRELMRQAVRERLEAVRSVLAQKGILYRVLDEYCLCAEPAFSNVQTLYPLRHWPIAEATKAQVIQFIEDAGHETPAGDLLEHLHRDGITFPSDVVLTMMSQRELMFDIEQQLDSDLVLSLPEERRYD